MTVIHTLVHNDDYFEYETDGRDFLKTLTREQLLWGLDEPEELSEKTDAELIELLAQEDLWEIYGTDIEDFYHEDAEREYEEVQQEMADIIYETYRDRL
jgi:hypothetical protein